MTGCSSDADSSSNLASSSDSTSIETASLPSGVEEPSGFDLQGHRGARGLLPENTLPAFRKALDVGVTTLELDVVISADSQVVVSHEPWMNHVICTTPGGERIPEDEEKTHNLYQMTYEEIAAYDCGQVQNPRFPEQETTSASKPLLRDVIRMAEAHVDSTGRVPVFYNVETKSRPDWEGTFQPDPATFAGLLADVLEAEGVTPRSTMQSFDPRTLQAAYDDGREVRYAMLIAGGLDEGFEQNLTRLSFVPSIYSPEFSLVDDALITAVQQRKMQVVPWTVNEKDDMRRLIDLGVDGLITDYPNRGVEVFRELNRGQ